MIRFNDTGIEVGYIKQLLHTFNLPSAMVYSTELDDILGNNCLYIKDNYINRYDGKKFIPLEPYIYNQFIPNYTRTLRLNSQLYDTHTHEYLGEYLRFLRDHNHLNLMGLYNCFSNNLVTKFEFTSNAFKVDTSDTNYKLYALPIKPNRSYTIAIESDTQYQLFCGLFGVERIDFKVTEGDRDISLEEKTNVMVGASSFNKPFIYGYPSCLGSEIIRQLMPQQECLKLFIRLPVSNNSSIVVLEGDYTTSNDRIAPDTSKPAMVNNYSVLNFENADEIDFSEANLISACQLLNLNSGISHPFSDRLLEYLCGNAITPLDPISDDIKRIQNILLTRKASGKQTGLTSISANKLGM